MSDDPILAALARLEAGQVALRHAVGDLATRTELSEVRVAVMQRIDRLQNTVTAIRDDVAVNLGAADAAQRANDNTRELVRSQGEQLNVMWRQLKALEAKVREITGDP
jgi:methyl-accepting chemotaxis protein